MLFRSDIGAVADADFQFSTEASNVSAVGERANVTFKFARRRHPGSSGNQSWLVGAGRWVGLAPFCRYTPAINVARRRIAAGSATRISRIQVINSCVGGIWAAPISGIDGRLAPVVLRPVDLGLGG